MSPNINWNLTVQVANGPTLSIPARVQVEAFNRVEVEIPATSTAGTKEVDIHSGSSADVKFLLIEANDYTTPLTYQVSDDGANWVGNVKLDTPQFFAGEGAVSLMGKAPKHLKFTNNSATAVKVSVLAGAGAYTRTVEEAAGTTEDANPIDPVDLSPEEAQAVLDFLNSATATQLSQAVETPGGRGGGYGIAAAILTQRIRLGGFTNVRQVADLSEVGHERFSQICIRVTGSRTAPSTISDVVSEEVGSETGGDSRTRHLTNFAEKLTPRHDWEDLGLPPANKRQLRQLVDRIGERSRDYADAGPHAEDRSPVVLFDGPWVAGKIIAAELIAGHQGADIYKIDTPTLVSKWVGETEKNLARLFLDPEVNEVILFFDEADAIFGSRTEVRDADDRWANIEINYLLQRIEEYDGVVILASSFRQNTEEAFPGRPNFLVGFPFPDPAAPADP